MANSEGSPALVSLKSSMQLVKKDRDRLREQYLQTVHQLDAERDRREQLKTEAEELNGKVLHMNEDYEQLSSKLLDTATRLSETTKYADECERGRRTLDHRRNMDEDRIAILDQMRLDALNATTESDRKFEEVSRKLIIVNGAKDQIDAKTEGIELKSRGVEEEMHVLMSKLKALESQMEQFSEREDKYERTINELRARIKNSESRCDEADKIVSKLEGEINQLKGELKATENDYQSLREELDPFARG